MCTILCLSCCHNGSISLPARIQMSTRFVQSAWTCGCTRPRPLTSPSSLFLSGCVWEECVCMCVDRVGGCDTSVCGWLGYRCGCGWDIGVGVSGILVWVWVGYWCVDVCVGVRAWVGVAECWCIHWSWIWTLLPVPYAWDLLIWNFFGKWLWIWTILVLGESQLFRCVRFVCCEWCVVCACTVCMVCNTFQTILLLSKVTFWLVMHTFPLILRSVILKLYPNLPISDSQQNNFVTTWQYMLALVNRYIIIVIQFSCSPFSSPLAVLDVKLCTLLQTHSLVLGKQRMMTFLSSSIAAIATSPAGFKYCFDSSYQKWLLLLFVHLLVKCRPRIVMGITHYMHSLLNQP